MAVAGRSRWSARLLASGMAAALLGGCVTAREQEARFDAGTVHAYIDDKPPELRRHFYIAQAQGQRNRILNDMRLGLATFAMGRNQLAEQLFDDALQGIEAVYADNEEAKKARQLLVKEQSKDFKGEPYERVMAYYYRGLLYLRTGDYQNARASFKGGMLQDAFAEEEQFRADFALMPFLQGWAAHCGGQSSLAAEDFKEFRDINKDAPLPRDQDTVLVLVETGGAPVKVSEGPRLKIRRNGAAETARILWTDPEHPKDRPKDATHVLEDIYRQASTRGGRQFDAILEGKAEYKSAADTVGNVALVGAVIAGQVAVSNSPRRGASKQDRERQQEIQRDAAMVGGALAVIGLLSKAAAHAIESEADIRYWDNLSDRVLGVTLALPDRIQKIRVEFGENHRPVEVPIVRSGRCGIAWVRNGNTLPSNPRAPNSAPSDVMTSPVIIPAAPAPPGPVTTPQKAEVQKE
ncbi:MAG: hypothetical protein Q7R40_08575 [Phaeospirillum sp.]|nr:hypothetical protein [Phaeospirillum sp.]